VGEPFGIFTSRVVPLAAENVDTDQIVPARYLKVTDKDGLAEALFRDWRFEEDGSLKDPPFVLDRAGMAGRAILLVGDNFGAGSSREHAPWALRSWGIRAILSTGFADIFRSNSLKNGVLPIVVSPDVHRRLWEIIERDPDAELTVDLAEEGVLLPGVPALEGCRDRRLGGGAPAADRFARRSGLNRSAGVGDRRLAEARGRPADLDRPHRGAAGADRAAEERGRQVVAVGLRGRAIHAERTGGGVAGGTGHRDGLLIVGA
jgi:3-isopropylmalate/(R)-2-methylmalate dehydratase small subunit